MDPITASGVISIGKELLNKVTTSIDRAPPSNPSSFSEELNKSQSAKLSDFDPKLKCEKLIQDIKSDLLKDPKTASFLQRNESNQVFLEKRADGSVQFISSSGENMVLNANTTECAKSLDLINLCIENNINLSSFRQNSVVFNS
jgi:hypothetical protein